MVIDLTRRPVFINTDICEKLVVVRTASNHQVDGRLRRNLEKNEHRRGRGEKNGGNNVVIVDIGATVETAHRTLLEVRLPLDHLVRRKADDPIPNPYEVATVYVDPFSNTTGTWRAQLLVEYVKNKNGGMWCITVRDDATKLDLFTTTAKELATGWGGQLSIGGQKLPDELLPLQRVSQAKAPLGPLKLSRWDRIRQIEYDPHPDLLGDEEP